MALVVYPSSLFINPVYCVTVNWEVWWHDPVCFCWVQREVFCGNKLENSDAAYRSHGCPIATMCHCFLWAHVPARLCLPPSTGQFLLSFLSHLNSLLSHCSTCNWNVASEICILCNFWVPESWVFTQVHQACQRKMLLVRGGQAQGQGHWPIPEAYWPDPSHPGIPPRDPHPVIAYKPMDADPYVPANFIFDKYEVLGVVWSVFLNNRKCLRIWTWQWTMMGEMPLNSKHCVFACYRLNPIPSWAFFSKLMQVHAGKCMCEIAKAPVMAMVIHLGEWLFLLIVHFAFPLKTPALITLLDQTLSQGFFCNDFLL